MRPRLLCAAWLLALVSQSDALLTSRPRLSAAKAPWTGCGKVPGKKVSALATKTLRTKMRTGPGAGLDLGEFVPFDFSFHDAYSPTACVLDGMRFTADKFGKSKFSYDGSLHNVSIVRYETHVAKEDREPMTHLVCFTFCRTVPDMLFFGLTNGRDCYCTPYFHASAGDSSECDLPCDGALEAPIVCGGKSKSNVFEMHNCGDGEKNLAKAHEDLAGYMEGFDEIAGEISTAASDLQSAAEKLQATFGQVGDPAASDLCQQAKVFAGEVEHEAEAATKLSEDAEAFGELEDPKKVQEMEKLTAELIAHLEKVEKEEKGLNDLHKKVIAPFFTHNSADLYYPVMYFVDMRHQMVPSTCGGTLAAKPLVGDFDRCAAACEAVVSGAKVGSCVAFQWLASSEGGVCFLFSELKTVTYYTGCSKSSSFLQRSAGGHETKCMAKLSRFQGTSLKPQKSGHCKSCLKEAKQADRCYE